MSNITKAILVHDLEDTDTALALHAWIETSGWFRSTGFVRVDHFIGRNDVSMESAVHIAGFNHLDEPALLEGVRSARWKVPKRVQLLIKRQDDQNFEEIDLWGNWLPGKLTTLAAGKAMSLEGSPAQRDFAATRGAGLVITEPWLFAVLRVHPEKWIRSIHLKPDGAESPHRAVLTVDCAYRGQPVRFTCDRAMIDYDWYQQVHKVLEEVNEGDAIEFAGKLYVDEAGIWQLSHPTMIRVSR